MLNLFSSALGNSNLGLSQYIYMYVFLQPCRTATVPRFSGLRSQLHPRQAHGHLAWPRLYNTIRRPSTASLRAPSQQRGRARLAASSPAVGVDRRFLPLAATSAPTAAHPGRRYQQHRNTPRRTHYQPQMSSWCKACCRPRRKRSMARRPRPKPCSNRDRKPVGSGRPSGK